MNGRMTSFYPEGCGVGYIYKGSTNTDADMAQKSDDQMTVISSINLFPYYLLFSILRVCLSIKCLWMGIMFLYIYIYKLTFQCNTMHQFPELALSSLDNRCIHTLFSSRAFNDTSSNTINTSM